MQNRRFVMYSNPKPIKALSDFPHKAIGNHFLCLAIAPYGFAVCERNADNSFHIKGKGAQQIFSCLPQCRRLNLRDNSSKFFVCYSLRNFPELCPVFFFSAAVSVLCVAPPGITAVSIFAICSVGTIIDYHFPSSPYPVAGGFGIGRCTDLNSTTTCPHRSSK